MNRDGHRQCPLALTRLFGHECCLTSCEAFSPQCPIGLPIAQFQRQGELAIFEVPVDRAA